MATLPTGPRKLRRVIFIGLLVSLAVGLCTMAMQNSVLKRTVEHLTLTAKKAATTRQSVTFAEWTGEELSRSGGDSGHSPTGSQESGGEHTQTSSSEDLARVFQQRRNVYQGVCSVWERRMGKAFEGGMSRLFFYGPANFSVCGVPKVGVTFWKRVFSFLLNRTGGQVTSPLEVDRHYVHRHSLWSGPRESFLDLLPSSVRVMFTRDPWSRLWSAYIDKFVLPDSWLNHGKNIVSLRNSLSATEAKSLRNQSELEQRLGENQRPSRALHAMDKIQCPDDITFAEFLRYVEVNANPHWNPVHRTCNPCVYQPQYLGKMETFGRDTAYILNTAGLSSIVRYEMSHSDHVLDELEQLTTYHYVYFHGRKARFASCLDKLGVARRLWRAFQLNAYIPADEPFPEASLDAQISQLSDAEAGDVVVKAVQGAHSARPLGHAEWSALKRRNMVAAYRSVPKEVLNKVQQKFQMDFELFQYDQQPLDIFGE